MQEGPRHLRVWSAALGGPDPRAAWAADADFVAVQADAAGHRVLAACADGSVWSWEPAAGTPPQRLTEFPSAPTLLRLSPDGQRVLLAGSNGFVRCWQVDPPKKLWSTQWHAGAVLDANWDAEGQSLLSSGADGRVMVWHATTGQPAGPDLLFTNVPSVAFAPQHRWFALAAQDQPGLRVRQLNPAENWPLTLAPVPMGAPIERVAFLASNVCFTVTSNRVWLSTFRDAPGNSLWTKHKILIRAPGPIPRASADGSLLAVPNADGSLTLHDTRTFEPAQAPLRTDAPIAEALVTHDSRSVLLRRVDDKLQFLPLDTLTPPSAPWTPPSGRAARGSSSPPATNASASGTPPSAPAPCRTSTRTATSRPSSSRPTANGSCSW